MADFNSNSPTLLGMEWRPQTSRSVLLSNTQAIVQRFRGSAVTPANLHAYLSSLSAANVCFEVCTTPIPVLDTILTVRPGTDTGTLLTGTWLNEAGGAASFTKVSDNSTATYLKNQQTNSAALWSYGVIYRGGASALSGKRVVSEQLHAKVQNLDTTSCFIANFAPGKVGVGPLAANEAISVAGSSGIVTVDFTTEYIDTGVGTTSLPFTQANVNTQIQTASGNGFGIAFNGLQNTANTFRCYEIWLTVQTCPENRLIASYATIPAAGWKPMVFNGAEGTGAAVALSANTWYYLVMWCPAGSTANVPLLQDVNVVYAANASSSTGEHRQASVASIGNSGVVSSMATATGEIAPFLLEAPAATIHTQSQPYVAIAGQTVGSGASVSQQLTAPGISSYSSVKVPIGWSSPSSRPDQPMTVEIRHGVGANTGGGSLDAIATIGINDLTSGATLQDFNAQFSAAFVSAAATQYFIYFRSSATAGKQWSVGRLDTVDTVLTTTTTAQVEGAGIGGTTDSSVDNSGASATRYDYAALIAGAGVPPAGVTVVSKVAA